MTTESQYKSMPISIKFFIEHCGITGFQLPTISFAPNIPKDKLSNAIASYGNGAKEADVVVLVDDTFWGSAKEGMLVTDDALLFNMKGDKPRRAKLEVLRELSSNDKKIVLNGKVVGSMTCPAKLELGCLFSMLDQYVKFAFRISPNREKNLHAMDMEALIVLCASYIKPEYIDQSLWGNFKPPTTRPGYFVGSSIPAHMERMVRFSLSLNEETQLIAVQELTRHKTGLGCFAITNEGLIAKREDEFESTFLPWHSLRELSVVAEHKEPYLRGVLLSNGQTLVTSWENSIVLPFGTKIVEDLILLASKDACGAPSKLVLTNFAQIENDEEFNNLDDVFDQISENERPKENQNSEKQIEIKKLELGQTNSSLPDANSPEDIKTRFKYIEIIARSIEANKPRIISLLKEKTGEASLNALHSDKNVILIASYLYAFLPALVRLALKEDVFLNFMLENRDRIIQHLIANGAIESPKAANLGHKQLSRSMPQKLSSVLSQDPISSSWFACYAEELGAGLFDPEKQPLLNLYKGMLQEALNLPEQLKNLKLLTSDAEFIALSQDAIIREILVYSFASISDLLSSEADFNDAQLVEFKKPLMEALLQPYFAQNPGKRSLRALAKPNLPEKLEIFDCEVRTLTSYLSMGDRNSMVMYWLDSVKAQLMSNTPDTQLAQALCTQLAESAPSLLQGLALLDEVNEGLLIDYFEIVGMPN